jgi:hypothetical protein
VDVVIFSRGGVSIGVSVPGVVSAVLVVVVEAIPRISSIAAEDFDAKLLAAMFRAR